MLKSYKNQIYYFKFSEEKEFPPKQLQAQEGLGVNGSAAAYSNSASGHHRTNVPEKVFRPESPHSILNIETRPLLREAPIGRAADRDDNKYKRKTPQEIFSRWSRLVS